MEDLAFVDLLECPVCLERLGVSAKVLPCQHTFCLPCLQKMVYGKAELRCPECRTPVTCEIEELPANLLLVRLLDGIRQGPGGMSKSNTVRRPEVFSSQDPSRKRPGDPRNSQALQHRHLQNTMSSLDGVSRNNLEQTGAFHGITDTERWATSTYREHVLKKVLHMFNVHSHTRGAIPEFQCPGKRVVQYVFVFNKTKLFFPYI